MANRPFNSTTSLSRIVKQLRTESDTFRFLRAASRLQQRWTSSTCRHRHQDTKSTKRPAEQISRIRQYATHARQPTQYQAVVVGAGPAGITVLGNLLERGVKPVLWVDNEFNGGRVNARYREVPSNTKVKLFRDFATATAPFRNIVGVPKGSTAVSRDDALTMLDGLDPEKGCHLSHAADMLLMLTEGLKRTDGVNATKGELVNAHFDEQSKTWHVKVAPHDEKEIEATSARLVLCTGSSPNNSPLPVHMPEIQVIDLDLALSPSKLEAHLANIKSGQVAVIGASHSAILVLRNLYNLAAEGKADIKIKWFTRHELRYAEFMDGWILRDNTGLKGEAATWAKENLEPDTLPKSDVSNYVKKIAYKAGAEKEVFAEELRGVHHYVQAIGFDKNPLPALTTLNGEQLNPSFDHESGSFSVSKSNEAKRLPGLFGAGIAWPERVKDPYGNVEYAVGFFKFMKFVKRVSPQWN